MFIFNISMQYPSLTCFAIGYIVFRSVRALIFSTFYSYTYSRAYLFTQKQMDCLFGFNTYASVTEKSIIYHIVSPPSGT